MNCRLRKLAASDLETVMHWRMLPEVTRHMYTDPQLTMEDQLRWFERLSRSESDRVWIIESGTPSLSVGVLSLSDINRVHRRCSWAYYIGDEAARARGLAKPLECGIYDYVFGSMQMNRLWCEVFSANDRVVALHERFGSKVEGVLRQHIFKDGQFYDVVRMAILKSDWERLKPSIRYSPIEIE
jgi:UDP-4-amino-4,6-dideoxy-N-acetyl-beta-L-altrosamine N-acetyltransferase